MEIVTKLGLMVILQAQEGDHVHVSRDAQTLSQYLHFRLIDKPEGHLTN